MNQRSAVKKYKTSYFLTFFILNYLLIGNKYQFLEGSNVITIHLIIQIQESVSKRQKKDLHYNKDPIFASGYNTLERVNTMYQLKFLSFEKNNKLRISNYMQVTSYTQKTLLV